MDILIKEFTFLNNIQDKNLFVVFILILLLAQTILMYKKLTEFPIDLKYYILSVVFSVVFFWIKSFSITISPYILVFNILIVLTIKDIIYYEINSKAYLFFITPILLSVLLGNVSILSVIIVFAFADIFMVLLDFLVSGNIGGADGKLLILIAPTFKLFNFVIFFSRVFLIAVATYLVMSIYKSIQNKKIIYKEFNFPFFINILLAFTIIIYIYK